MMQMKEDVWRERERENTSNGERERPLKYTARDSKTSGCSNRHLT